LRVLLATDRPSLGAALSVFLSERQVEVVGVVAQADDLLTRAQALQADIVIVDQRLGDAAVEQTVADASACAKRTPVIILGASQDARSADVFGADGFAVLGDPPEALLALMHEVSPAVL
jgi:DNA-binding NarL/FixJ family response regulator